MEGQRIFVLDGSVSTCSAKYIFLDVVGFTSGRSVEAQTEIVRAINRIVSEAISVPE